MFSEDNLRAIFKQHAFLSEKGNDSLEQQME